MLNAYLKDSSLRWTTPEIKMCKCLRLFMEALKRNTPLSKQTIAREPLIWLTKMTNLHIV